MERDLSSCRMIKDERTQYCDALTDCSLQLVAEFNGAERVYARLHEWCICVYGAACSLLHHLKDCAK
jgi:hypothetical protein